MIGSYTLTGTNVSTGSNSGSGWPIFAKWSNGDSTHPSEAAANSYRYFTGSDDTSIVWTVPAATTSREFAIYVGIGQAKARVTATVSGTSTTAFHDEDTGAGSNKFLRVAIAYASPTPGTTMQVRLQMLQRHNTTATSALSFGSATLH